MGVFGRTYAWHGMACSAKEEVIVVIMHVAITSSWATCLVRMNRCCAVSVRIFGGVHCMQGVDGVPNIQEGLNPATWMLEVTTPGMEDKLGVNFAEYYSQSELAK